MISLMNNNRANYLKGQKPNVDQLLLGSSVKRTLEADEYVREFAYKCIFTTKSIKQGEIFTLFRTTAF